MHCFDPLSEYYRSHRIIVVVVVVMVVVLVLVGVVVVVVVVLIGVVCLFVYLLKAYSPGQPHRVASGHLLWWWWWWSLCML